MTVDQVRPEQREAVTQVQAAVAEIARGLDALTSRLDRVEFRNDLEELHASLVATANTVESLMQDDA